ncbi:MAG: LysR family transcriptional regulator [Pseudomonadota bacterium]
MNKLAEIEAFVQIARAGSISAAAMRLNMAKSAVSRRLADLEERLGVQLMNRTTRRISLTDAGAVFLRRATSLLDDLDEAEAEAGAGQTELIGKLKIAAPLSFGVKHLRPLISRFTKTHPQLDIEIDFSDRRIDLVEEGVDVAVRIGVLADSSLIARKLCPIRNNVAASPDFWKRHGVPKRPSDLEGLPCLRYSNLARPEIIPFWGPGGESGAVSAAIKVFANNGDFLTDMSIDGHGFLVEPSFFLFEHIEATALQPVLCDFAWSNMNLYVVYPPTRQLSARVRAFINILVERFQNNPYWDDKIRAVIDE